MIFFFFRLTDVSSLRWVPDPQTLNVGHFMEILSVCIPESD